MLGSRGFTGAWKFVFHMIMLARDPYEDLRVIVFALGSIVFLCGMWSRNGEATAL